MYWSADMEATDTKHTLPKLGNGNLWAALDPMDSSVIIAQGIDPSKVAESANETGEAYILTYVPSKDETYIFLARCQINSLNVL